MGVRERRILAQLALLAFAVLATTGCQIGPGRMKVAGSHYSDAVRVAAGEQLLANLVRLRFRDSPLFLAITNISTQFELNSDLSVSGTRLASSADAGVGAGISYSERPTITFAIMGEKPSRSAC